MSKVSFVNNRWTFFLGHFIYYLPFIYSLRHLINVILSFISAFMNLRETLYLT